MRHSTINPTMNTYTDPKLLDVALHEKLERLYSEQVLAHVRGPY
jgi:hypothetical protein